MKDVEQLDYLQYLLSKLTPRQRQFIIDKHLMGFTADEMLSQADGVKVYMPIDLPSEKAYVYRTNKKIISRLQKFDLEHRRIYGVRTTQHGVS